MWGRKMAAFDQLRSHGGVENWPKSREEVGWTCALWSVEKLGRRAERQHRDFPLSAGAARPILICKGGVMTSQIKKVILPLCTCWC